MLLPSSVFSPDSDFDCNGELLRNEDDSQSGHAQKQRATALFRALSARERLRPLQRPRCHRYSGSGPKPPQSTVVVSFRWDFPKIRASYFGVLIIRIPLFRVLY